MQSEIFVAVLFIGSVLGSLDYPQINPYPHMTSHTAGRYRSDYIYNEMTRSYYKVHLNKASYRVAWAICHMEGAGLMETGYPEEVKRNEIDLVVGELQKSNHFLHDIWTGRKTNHFRDDDQPPINACAMINNNKQVIEKHGRVACGGLLPFVCKQTASFAVYDEQCGVYGTDYTYFYASHSCYKVSPVSYTWEQAYQECKAAGAHLVVIKSQVEARDIKDLLEDTQTPKQRSDTNQLYFVGIWLVRWNRTGDGSERVFKTILNGTLEEAGYSEWSAGQPSNKLTAGSEYCGAISSVDGKLNLIDCSKPHSFICKSIAPGKKIQT